MGVIYKKDERIIHGRNLMILYLACKITSLTLIWNIIDIIGHATCVFKQEDGGTVG